MLDFAPVTAVGACPLPSLFLGNSSSRARKVAVSASKTSVFGRMTVTTCVAVKAEPRILVFENLARVRWGCEIPKRQNLGLTAEPLKNLSENLLCVSESQTIKLKGLILAQNERQRRGLGMQVERDP